MLAHTALATTNGQEDRPTGLGGKGANDHAPFGAILMATRTLLLLLSAASAWLALASSAVQAEEERRPRRAMTTDWHAHCKVMESGSRKCRKCHMGYVRIRSGACLRAGDFPTPRERAPGRPKRYTPPQVPR
jgi:hypothetical protein